MTANTESNCATLLAAARLLRKAAHELQISNTPCDDRNDWRGDLEAQAIYTEQTSVANALEAIVQAAPARIATTDAIALVQDKMDAVRKENPGYGGRVAASVAFGMGLLDQVLVGLKDLAALTQADDHLQDAAHAWEVENAAFGFWTTFRKQGDAEDIQQKHREEGYGESTITPLYRRRTEHSSLPVHPQSQTP